MNLSKADFQSIQKWMYRNARPVDLARWQLHFENGSQEAVLAALEAYQNEDGGFGHALEADSWNPHSSPYTTSVVVHLLEEIEFQDGKHRIIQNMLRYLEATPEFDGKRWPATVRTNHDYPHAPWWTDAGYDWGYTPTAVLAGFVLRYAEPQSNFYQKAKMIAAEAIETYRSGSMPDGKPYHKVQREGEIQGLMQMLAFIEAAGLGAEFCTAETREILKQQAEAFIEKDDRKWGEYCWKPSIFVRSPDSLFYPENEKAIETEMDYLLKMRNLDGVWDPNWSWGAYENEFAISRNWWKANLVLENLRMLRAFGRLDQG